ncbi:MAG: NAD(P)-binding protein [Steroidobacteraceae bacterium]
MTDKINRRDLLNGVALLVAGGLAPLGSLVPRAQARAREPGYPPLLEGIRGDEPGCFETAHLVAREGKSFDITGLAVDEQYDLIVIGGGASGLAAAFFYREQHGPSSRILIVENHDDFGGHARRNEFWVDGRRLIGYGGSESLQSPQHMFSPTVRRLLAKLGVTLSEARWEEYFDRNLYGSLGLSNATFFDRATFGLDRLVVGTPTVTGADSWASRLRPSRPIETVTAQFPMSASARARLIALYTHHRDYLTGKSKTEKLAYLRRVSYRDYLIRDAGLGTEAVKFFDGSTKDFWGMGPDIVPAYGALSSRYPGFAGLGLDDEIDPAYSEPYIYHFPDGNASIVRLLARSLIPAVAPGHTMEDVVLADFDYAKLDDPGSPVRLRLKATAVKIVDRPGGVDVGYVRAGQLRRVRARHCVLACWNRMIPHIMPQLPLVQRQALELAVKQPLVYVNVALRNWRSFTRLGVEKINSPHAYFCDVKLDYPVAMGGYRNPRSPDEPILIHMIHVPLAPNQGLSDVEQYKVGRYELLTTTFAEYEAEVVDQLTRMLGAGGFGAARDIAAITVNRWPHGYAYTFDTLFDKRTNPMPYVIARRGFGNVAIANSDAGWNAYLHEAIDEAWRAVEELRAA